MREYYYHSYVEACLADAPEPEEGEIALFRLTKQPHPCQEEFVPQAVDKEEYVQLQIARGRGKYCDYVGVSVWTNLELLKKKYFKSLNTYKKLGSHICKGGVRPVEHGPVEDFPAPPIHTNWYQYAVVDVKALFTHVETLHNAEEKQA